MLHVSILPSVFDSYTIISLYLLSINDHESCAELLLDRYAKELVSACDDAGRSTVHAAAFNNHVECLQLLLRYEASSNTIDQMGRTPLMMAANYGHSAAVGKHQSR